MARKIKDSVLESTPINSEVVLSVKDLQVSFSTDHGRVHAVRGVSFDLHKGETLCIVGESGSGKSVTSKTIMGILSANGTIESGSIMFRGEDLVRISEEEFHRIRGHKIGMIFQDPMSSLNPIMKVGKQITEATLVNKNILKRRYSDFISPQLTALLNTEVNAKYEIERLKAAHSNYLADAKKAAETAYNKVERVKNEISAFYSNSKNKLKLDKKAKIDAAAGLDNSKALIAEAEAEYIAKLKELDATYAERKSKYQADLAVAKTVLAKATEEYKAKGKEIEAKIAPQIVAIKNKLKSDLPALKLSLKKAKLAAKASNKEYLAELTLKRDTVINKAKEELAKLNKELKAVKGSDELAKVKLVEEKISETNKIIADANEEFINHTQVTKAEAKKMALNVMKEVGIPLPERRFKQYPFEFSGGMRQRIVIAIALTANPDILICDEPTTALDVTIQAQILELINKLKEARNMSCIFITHDLGVVANMADRVAVMYAGKIVEYGLANEIFYDPKHPYTWALLSSIPDIDSKEKLESIPGTPPNMIYPPKGDAFALRSRYAMAIDFEYEPPYFKVSETHYAATWLLHPKAPKVELPKIVSTRIKKSLEGGNKNG